MKRLIYRSIANPDLEADDVFDIVQGSSARNGSRGLSGFLLFHERQFLQLLEGDSKAIDDLFGKVRIDGRHSHVEVLFEAGVNARCFPRWRMHRIVASDPADVLTFLTQQQAHALSSRETALIGTFLRGTIGDRSNAAA